MAGVAVFEKHCADERAAKEEVARQVHAEVARQAANADRERVEAQRQAAAQLEMAPPRRRAPRPRARVQAQLRRRCEENRLPCAHKGGAKRAHY
jgi:hypothetical protein